MDKTGNGRVFLEGIKKSDIVMFRVVSDEIDQKRDRDVLE